MDFNQIYFYTATIADWKDLLRQDEMKLIIVQSLQNLIERKKVKIYGYVIMPNHIHLLWKMIERNGKESPANSFMKFTAHQFLEKLRSKDIKTLKPYEVDWLSRKHNFWQRDSLAIELYTEMVLVQKLHYIHVNPLQEKWQLASLPEQYDYSSAQFYYSDGKERSFGFLTHYQDRT